MAPLAFPAAHPTIETAPQLPKAAAMTTYDRFVDSDHGIVSREIFVSDGIFGEELEKLFSRAWLFVGHESQIPSPRGLFHVADGRRVGDPLPRPGEGDPRLPQYLPAPWDEGVPL